MSDLKILRCRRSNQTFYIHLPNTAPISSLHNHMKELLQLDENVILRVIKFDDMQQAWDYVLRKREGADNIPQPAFLELHEDSVVADLENMALVYLQMGEPGEDEVAWEGLENVVEEDAEEDAEEANEEYDE